MGGPNPEAYRRAKEAQRRRIAALRTRGGVVDLAELRQARRSAEAIGGVLRHAAWFADIRVVPAPAVGFELRVTLRWDSPQARMCLPSAVDDIPVRVEVRNAKPRPSKN